MLRSFLVEPYQIQFAESVKPSPGPGEVLVRLKMAGVCGSDVHMYQNGHRLSGPLTIGHEGMGIIESVGEGVSGERIEERVVIEPNIPCGDCPECWKGKGNVCRNKRIIGVNETGCFAEYICLPGAYVHMLPESVSDVDAVAMEPAVVALSALNRSNSKPGDAIAVIGLGAIGMLLTHIALNLGYRVLVTELVQSKIDKAVQMGAVSVKGGESPGQSAGILESAFQREEITGLFECAGSERSATLAIEAAPRGVDVILMGLSEEGTTFKSRILSRKGNRIIPSLIYDHPFDFKRGIHLVERGIIHPGTVISKYFAFQDLAEALEESQKGKEGKIVIRISDH
jgi:L-iditol 2-dehydrogenase